MFAFDAPRQRRKPSLTPMIDVVFLLLVFFMLASRFGTDMHLTLNAAGQGRETPYEGPPRLIDILPDGVELNGRPVGAAALPEAILPLVGDNDDTIILRARDGADLQKVVDVMQRLSMAGFTRLVLVE
ncbi:MAG: ExbD/TolR family protein [Pseudomonadota bacterium]|uniref:ExbD/TolR family protein n=1 Tax=Roseovarius TaxID=74030 RepID=UPI0022A8591C|nr:biopolymer transporter ExbD [Roseovarius sp. EGI FJ00037]MCZ0812884.1 biopolymer transporter ExbD [Roseovarius sp. EGI FJ00037]